MLGIWALEGERARPSGATNSDFIDQDCSACRLAPRLMHPPASSVLPAKHLLPPCSASDRPGSCVLRWHVPWHFQEQLMTLESHLCLFLLSLPLDRLWRRNRSRCQPRTHWWRRRSLASHWTTAFTKTSLAPSQASVRLGAPFASLWPDSESAFIQQHGSRSGSHRRTSESEFVPWMFFSWFWYLMIKTPQLDPEIQTPQFSCIEDSVHLITCLCCSLFVNAYINLSF